MEHTRMRQRTELSSSQDQFQSSKPFKRLRLDKQERTAREDQRNRPYAKLTMPKVDLALVKTNALLLQYANQSFNLMVEAVQEMALDMFLNESKKLK